MDRLACVDVADLPLQLVLRERPSWADGPVAVIDEDRPQGVLLWVNERARAMRVLPGQRYADALGLTRELRATVVPPAAIGAAVARLTEALRQLTPDVEPSVDEPGVFWLDATGLRHMHASLDAWGDAVRAALAVERLSAAVVVGFTRFGSYALAKATPPGRVRVLPTLEAERELVAQVPLDRLALAATVRERLARLDVHTVGAFLALPPVGLLKRYGPRAYELWRLARGELFAPLRPVAEQLDAAAGAELDFTERDTHRLLFRVKRLLDEIVRVLRDRQAVIASLRLALDPDVPPLTGGRARPQEAMVHHFRPAAPTLDATLLMDLIRLRLESVDLGRGVVGVHLSAQEIAANPEQLRIFGLAPRRDLAAAERALARIRADLGDAAVGHFVLREGHLPKARFAFRPLERLRPPRPRPAIPDDDAEVGALLAAPGVLVRRVYPKPLPLGWPRPPAYGRLRSPSAACPELAPVDREPLAPVGPSLVPTDPKASPASPADPRDPVVAPAGRAHAPRAAPRREVGHGGWLARRGEQGTVTAVTGPYVLSGGWWAGEVHREYAFAETERGDLLWVYYDRRRHTWLEEGRVE